MERLAIKSNYVVLPGGVRSAYVLIENGRIKDIVTELAGNEITIIDVGNKVLMPGVIDPHVHINEPGRTDWEGFDTGTGAALAGGITSIVDMPLNASPVTTSVKAFHEKLTSAGNNLHVNCGFWGGIVPGNEKDIIPLAKEGVLGFKAFLTHSGIDEFPNVSETDLRLAMPLIAACNLPLLVHCEISGNTPATVNNNPVSYQQYLSSRPKNWENEAVDLMIRLSREFNCRVHIVHLSSADALQQIRAAKEENLRVTVETAQHYLYFSAEEIMDGQTILKCAPPIREKNNNELLWQALKEGVIDFVATDHSPAPPELKELQSGNFMKAWGGISSLQFALPVLWTAARKKGFSIRDVSNWLCAQPSQLLGSGFKKGKIQRGYDADLVVWDPDKSFKVSANGVLHKHKITPYLNHQLFGVVEQTWLAGVKVYDKQLLKRGQGKCLLNKDNQNADY